MYIIDDLLPCGDISRAAFIGMRYAVTFKGWWDFEVWQDSEEYGTCRYLYTPQGIFAMAVLW